MLHLFTSENKKSTAILSDLKNTKHILFRWSLFLLPVGLLFGEVPTSIAEITVCFFWLMTGDFKEKLKKLSRSFYFYLLSSLFVLHIAGLLYTQDFNYAFNDLRVKIPLLLFPVLFFSTDYISFKDIVNILKWTALVTFINLLYLWINKQAHANVFLDTRMASVFISHIRLGLISAFAVITTVYIWINYSSRTEKYLFGIIFLGLLYLMMSLSLMTGLAVLIITSLLAITYMLVKNYHSIYFKGILLICLAAILGFMLYFNQIHHKYFPTNIPQQIMYTHTTHNNPYTHKINAPYTENAYWVFINICDKELQKEWEKRSHLPYNGKDKRGNELKYTLYRYLTSKGLTKDSTGMSQLNAEDIKHIEQGIPNHFLANANFLEKRLYELMQEYHYYKASKNPQGKTLFLRFIYWKIGFQIWMKNFWWGVGTGDVQQSFQSEYKHYPDIPAVEQLRAHHQFLTFALTFGSIGLALFLIIIFYPLIQLRNTNNYMLYFLLSSIYVLSFFIDDTLETQPGVTFYTLYNTLLIKWLLITPNEKVDPTHKDK